MDEEGKKSSEETNETGNLNKNEVEAIDKSEEDIKAADENKELKTTNEREQKESIDEIKEIEQESDELKDDTIREEKMNNEHKSELNIKKKSIIVCTLIIVAIIVTNFTVSKYENIVYPGISIYNHEVSKLTKEQLNNELYKIENDLNNKIVNIKAYDKNYNIKIDEIVLEYHTEKMLKEIMNYKKESNIFEKLVAIINPTQKQFKLDVSLDEEKIKELETQIAADTNIEVKEPKAAVEDDNVNYIMGEYGISVRENSLYESIENSLKDLDELGQNIEINVTYNREVPKIATEDIESINYKISTYSTTYQPGGGRGKNVEIAAQKIDNIVLMPGDEFSYEESVGPISKSNGYAYAPVIVDGELVQGIGGGVCQVSSTLYNTTLKAGIIPTERRNHSKPVSYVPRGLDATLASGSIDYKFINTYDYPILINTRTEGGTLTVDFWSNEKALDGIEYEPVSYVRGNHANTYLYGYDKSGEKVYENHIDTSVYR